MLRQGIGLGVATLAMAWSLGAAAAVPGICLAPKNEAQAITCADPELRALELGFEKLWADTRADAAHGLVMDEDKVLDWRKTVADCTARDCVRAAYLDWLNEIVGEAELHMKGGQAFRRWDKTLQSDWKTRNDPADLWLYDVGDGWRLFLMTAAWASLPPSDPRFSPHSGSAAGVILIDGDAAEFRDEDDLVLKFSRRKSGGWDVEEAGQCRCGADVHLFGYYRPSGKPPVF